MRLNRSNRVNRRLFMAVAVLFGAAASPIESFAQG